MDASVIDVARDCSGFSVKTRDGKSFLARKLLLAAGVIDSLPPIEGWEVRDQALAVYARGDDKGGGLALELTLWSRDVVLCTDGPAGLSTDCVSRLAQYNVPVREERIVRLAPSASKDELLFEIVFEKGPALPRRALFFNTSRRQSTKFAQQLGCEMYEEAGCNVDSTLQSTNVPGLYVAGDASRDVLQAIVAAAEGAQAAIAINNTLLKERFSSGCTDRMPA